MSRVFSLARTEIRQGRFERSMALMTAFAAIVSGWEAYAQHLRGAFSHWLMWTPVALTPPTVVAALGALLSKRIARRVVPVLAVISLIDGVVGFVFHLRGVLDGSVLPTQGSANPALTISALAARTADWLRRAVPAGELRSRPRSMQEAHHA
jgi:hypothetical protein